MGKYKIYVYAICKNEEKFAERWYKSMSEADGVYVTDTGSTDNTVEKLKALGAVVNVAKLEPFAFDEARNISLSHVPKDADICICTDLDEYFSEGWREKLENAWQDDATCGEYPFHYHIKADGTRLTMNGFKIHTRLDYKWVKPIHEYLTYIGGAKDKRVYISDIEMFHEPDLSKSRDFYFDLIESYSLNNPDDLMGMYNLVREYHNHGKWEKCVKLGEEYYKKVQTKDNYYGLIGEVERRVACCYYEMGKKTECYVHFYRSIAETPNFREPYVEFVVKAYNFKDYELAFAMAKTALKITERYNYAGSLAHAWDHTLDDYAAMSCYYLGLYQMAVDHSRKALEILPNDQRLIDNMNLYIRVAKEKNIEII